MRYAPLPEPYLMYYEDDAAGGRKVPQVAASFVRAQWAVYQR